MDAEAWLAHGRESYRRHRGCSRKIRHSSKRRAKELARKWGQRVYKCPYCDGWHLASRGKKSEQTTVDRDRLEQET